MGRVNLLVIQPTPFCNIDCSYCYLPNRNSKQRISEEVLAATGRMIAQSGCLGDELDISWHAGEPLILAPSWYERAFEVIRAELPDNLRITHLFQSNGMLINDAWCKFFKRPDVALGLSLDGPRAIHDRHRKARNGTGTFAAAISGLRRTVEADIDFHVITVLAADSLFFPDELYDFYIEEGIRSVGFNVEEIEGVNEASSLSDPRMAQLYRRFLNRFLSRIEDDEGMLSLREWDQVVWALARSQSGGGKTRGNEQNTPFEIVSVAATGDFATFSPELLGLADSRGKSFAIGNVLHDSIEDALASPRHLEMQAEIAAGARQCHSTCSYFDVCGGGAPANKYFETGRFDATETLHCRFAIKHTTDMVVESLRRRDNASCETSGQSCLSA